MERDNLLLCRNMLEGPQFHQVCLNPDFHIIQDEFGTVYRCRACKKEYVLSELSKQNNEARK